jgi:hypothetical protein
MSQNKPFPSFKLFISCFCHDDRKMANT